MSWECHAYLFKNLRCFIVTSITPSFHTWRNALMTSTSLRKPQRYMLVLELYLFFTNKSQTIEAIDPFLHFTVTQALGAYEKRQPCLHLEMQSDLIAEPLQKLLSGRGDSIIQRLKILESRYTRYKTSEDLGSRRVFDTSTDFFSALGSKGATTLAREMTNRAFESFKQLSLNGLRSYDEHIRDLATQWDKLNRSISTSSTNLSCFKIKLCPL